LEDAEQGYYTKDLRNKLINSKFKFTFIKQNYKNKFETVGGLMQVKTINFLNNQMFRINKLMLNYLISEWNSNNSIFFKGLNKFHIDTHLIESKSKISKNKQNLIESHNSKHLLYKNILEMAIIYKNIDFYLPVVMDFRGRINPQPQYLHYHSSDLARCLIEFSNGCEINETNINLVYQALANTAGKSKITIKNKEKWAKEFLEKLNFKSFDLNTIFNNPLIIDLINNIDEIGQFLSLLTSLLQLKNNNLFHTPICFDATCSGIQHLSAILSDIQLAKETNVIPIEDNSDNPQDIYSLLANEVSNTINNLEDKELRTVLKKILITRKLMKKPAMTVPYNVGLQKMTDQLINAGFFSKEYDDLSNKYLYYIVDKSILKEDETLILSDYQFGMFTSILFTVIFKKFPSLKEFKNYVDKLTLIILKLNKPLIWVTPAPASMKISQSYRIFKPYLTKSLYSNIKYNKITISLPTTNLDIKKK
jgi:DNA-directed RNA polymerase